uniref:SPIN90/Ldb17 leucine-rich domain-containing protein n=1 Tax=Noctiluca scintillans TaxID=2966 RepID=A0A7S0ZQB7_NOCSC
MAAVASPHTARNSVFSLDVPDVQAKAAEKREIVQKLIRNLERAERNDGPVDRAWLKQIINPKDQCFQTLIKLLVAPKYEGFVSLRCVCLRAMQMMLRIATRIVVTANEASADSTHGVQCFLELAGEKLAREAYALICNLVESREDTLLACNALLVLAEMGPQTVAPHLAKKLFALFMAVPERADELMEVALRMHSWGGERRSALLEAMVSHAGGRLLGEVLLQVINRGDGGRRARAAKILTGCLALPQGERLLYTNDVLVLIEILLRELPCTAGDVGGFEAHANCLLALTRRCGPAGSNRRGEFVQIIVDVRDDERNPQAVRRTCTQMLASLDTQ